MAFLYVSLGTGSASYDQPAMVGYMDPYVSTMASSYPHSPLMTLLHLIWPIDRSVIANLGGQILC